MIISCTADGEHANLKESFCGLIYDDAECSTICPHEPLPKKLTEAQLQEFWDFIKKEDEIDLNDNG